VTGKEEEPVTATKIPSLFVLLWTWSSNLITDTKVQSHPRHRNQDRAPWTGEISMTTVWTMLHRKWPSRDFWETKREELYNPFLLKLWVLLTLLYPFLFLSQRTRKRNKTEAARGSHREPNLKKTLAMRVKRQIYSLHREPIFSVSSLPRVIERWGGYWPDRRRKTMFRECVLLWVGGWY